VSPGEAYEEGDVFQGVRQRQQPVNRRITVKERGHGETRILSETFVKVKLNIRQSKVARGIQKPEN